MCIQVQVVAIVASNSGGWDVKDILVEG